MRLELTCFQDQAREQYSNLDLSFEEWHGDMLTDLIFEAFLREELLPVELRSNLRKALALVDEPEAAITHFTRLIEAIHHTATSSDAKRRLTSLRQMQICLWILYMWASEAGNLEAPQRCSQLVTLRTWDLCANSLGKATKDAKARTDLFSNAVLLQTSITDAYVEKIAPASGTYHGIGVAIGSITSLDVNLKLFDLVGRLGLHGLWLIWLAGRDPEGDLVQKTAISLRRVRHVLVDIVENNPALRTPIKDAQALDINLAMLFLMSVGEVGVLQVWVSNLVLGTRFAYLRHFNYPSMVREYRALLAHPKIRDDAYRKSVTVSSILYPTLAVWAKLLGLAQISQGLAEFAETELTHCAFQVWFPDAESGEKLFAGGDDNHGLANCDLKITGDGQEPLQAIVNEIEAHNGLSSILPASYGLHALILQACRYSDMPSPPQYWLQFSPKPSLLEPEGLSSAESA